jgi:hypothetical protein
VLLVATGVAIVLTVLSPTYVADAGQLTRVLVPLAGTILAGAVLGVASADLREGSPRDANVRILASLGAGFALAIGVVLTLIAALA